jgi:hypothetical protein
VVDGARNNTTRTKPDEDEADPGEEEADPVHSTTARTTGTEEAEEEDRRFPEYQQQVRSRPHQIWPRGTETKPAAGLSQDLVEKEWKRGRRERGRRGAL